MEPLLMLFEGVSGRSGRGQAGEIKLHQIERCTGTGGSNLVGGSSGLVHAATRHHYARTFASELQGSFVADAAVGTSDDYSSAGKIRKIIFCPGFGGHEV